MVNFFLCVCVCVCVCVRACVHTMYVHTFMCTFANNNSQRDKLIIYLQCNI